MAKQRTPNPPFWVQILVGPLIKTPNYYVGSFYNFVVQNNQLLLGKRKNMAGDGTWGLPGGHVEYGESLVEAAERELEEETGLRAKELFFHNFVNSPRKKDSVRYLHINFETRSVEGKSEVREPNKCSEWRWFDLNNLPDNIFIGIKTVSRHTLKKILLMIIPQANGLFL